MIELIAKFAATSAVFMGLAGLLPDIKVKSWPAAMGSAAVFGVLNVTLGWVLGFAARIVTFPLYILTLGLWSLVVPLIVNAIVLKVTDGIMEDKMDIEGFRALFILAATLSAVNLIVGLLL